MENANLDMFQILFRPNTFSRFDNSGVDESKFGFLFLATGLKQICATSADEAYRILTIGKKNLQMACTKLNHNSSRRYIVHCFLFVSFVS